MSDTIIAEISKKSIQSTQTQTAETADSIMTLVADSSTATQWAFNDFIVDGDQIIIAGAPKAGKSWLALQLSLAAASGGRFLSWHASRKMKTLYLNLEVGRQMWSKRVMMQIGGASNAPDYTHFFSRSDLRTIDVNNAVELKSMRDYIEAQKYEFVVIDVLSRCHSVDENDNGSMKGVLFALRMMCGKATSVVVHHARKPPSGSEHANLGASSIRGASSIVGEVDAALVLVKRAGQGARYSLSMTARNVDVPDELLLDVIDSSTMLYSEYSGEVSLVSVLTTAFSTQAVIQVNELRKLVAQGLGVAEGTARNYINQAVAQGLIFRQKVGKFVEYKSLLSANYCPF